ncbi:MAG: cytochrome c3 family protein [Deltaproteobacteria bacterium]|jgi:hypothetical protein|nr:cytochrome c3 family protein [Deltaproteobacteria bacterium]
MKKKALPLLPAILACLGVPAAFSSASPAVQPPAAPTELNWTRRPVPFSHQTHLRALSGPAAALALVPSCASCHHPVQGEIPYLSCAVKGCHDNLNSRDSSVRSYYLATHKKEKEPFWSCLSCHLAQAGQDPERLKTLAGCRASLCHE